MVIDLEGFQNISVNSTGVVQVGGGVRLGNLALRIYNQSKRALPHGVCPGVGIGGHASHGGYCKSGLFVQTESTVQSSKSTRHFQNVRQGIVAVRGDSL